MSKHILTKVRPGLVDFPTAVKNENFFHQKRQIGKFFKSLFGKGKKTGEKGKNKPEKSKCSDLNSCSVVEACDLKMPVVGLGTWQSSPECVEEAVITALNAGYRHFDTAYIYNNEDAIGRALEKAIRCGIVGRKELFISGKLPNFGMRPDLVSEYLYRSLKRLKLDYFDLYSIHFPVGLKNPLENPDCPEPDPNTCIQFVWQAMENEVYNGYIKNIGISNFNQRQIEQIVSYARIPPTNLQIEIHLYCQQKELVNFCRCSNITVCAYAPLGSPGLINYLTKKDPAAACGPKFPFPLADPFVKKIAKTKKKSPGQILLRYLLQLGLAVVPKSTDSDRICQNIQLFDFCLTQAEMSELTKRDKGNDGRMFHKNVWKGLECHPEFPFPGQTCKT